MEAATAATPLIKLRMAFNVVSNAVMCDVAIDSAPNFMDLDRHSIELDFTFHGITFLRFTFHGIRSSFHGIRSSFHGITFHRITLIHGI
jgi:hypothetical protein